MSNLAYRNNTVLPDSNSEPSWGSNYTIVVYEVGGMAASGSSGTSVTLRSGHGFAASDKLILEASGSIDVATYRTVNSVAGNVLTIDSALSVSAGDKIINLGPDTGTTEPNYDGSPISIYADMAGEGSAVSNAEVTATAQGLYEYWTATTSLWVLVRTSGGTPLKCIPDVFFVENVDVDSVTVEPSASALMRGKLRIVQGGTGVADQLIVCLKDEADDYGWVLITDGSET